MSDIATNASTTPTPTPAPAAQPTQSADWMSVQLQAPDKSLADIYSMGVDPNSTTLQDKNFYKGTKKIQSMFTQPNGQFDDKAFNQFYNNAAQSFNNYQKGDFDLGNVTTDLWNDTPLARSLGAPINKNPTKVSLVSADPFTNLKTAQKSFFGLNEIGKWTAPKKSLAEVAQGQKVMDGVTGKELDYTPEDTNLFNLFGFFGDPLVMAQYDDDVKGPDGKIIHKKGEMKFDDKGLPRYETLAGRDVAGKQILSRWNTLTKEDSFANKLDFMDSDDIQKSFTGSLVKGAVELLPLALGGPISTAYQAYYIASNLLDATAQIGKSIDGILNNDAKSGTFYKWANTLQGWTGQQKTDLSEYGRQNMFSLENLANQAVDAVLMMTAQNTVFTYPTKIRQYQMAKALGAAEGSPLKSLLLTPEAESKLGNTIMDFDKYMAKYKDEEAAGKALLANVNELEKYQAYSGHMATAYMAATMATGITQSAKAAGLNDRDTGMLYLGYMGALAGFFKLGVATWVHDGLKVDELAQDMNAKTIEYASKYLPKDIEEAGAKIGAEAGKATDQKGRGLQLLAAGRNMGKKIAEFYTTKVSHAKMYGFGVAGAAGGLEMGGLEAMKAGVQGIYNSLQSQGLTSTKGDARFDLTVDGVASDIGSAMFGGAFGGAVFHVLDKAEHQTYKADDLVSYVLNGYGSKLVDRIQDLQKKGQLGSKALSITPLKDDGGAVLGWSPVNKDNPTSHNDFIADRMLKTIKSIDAMRRAYGVDPQKAIEQKNKMYQAIVDTGTDTDLRDRIHSTFSALYNASLDLAQNPEMEHVEGSTQTNDTKNKIKELTETLLHLQGDTSMDEFFGQGLFNIRTDINNAFGVRTRDDFAKEVNPAAKSYAGLGTEDKAKVDTQFDEYKSLDGPKGMKWDLIHGKEDYDLKMSSLTDQHLSRLELYKESLKTLPDYTQIAKSIYQDDLGKAVSVMYDIQLQDMYLSKLAGIKYIPDRIYDDIKSRLTTMQSEGAATYLNILAPDIQSLKKVIYKNLGEVAPLLQNEHLNDFLKKKLGDKEFTELQASEEWKDLIANKGAASDYSLLKVLKGLTNYHTNQEDQDLMVARKVVNGMLEEDVMTLLDNFHNPDQGVHALYPELVNYMTKHKVGDYLTQLDQEGNHSYLLYDSVAPKDLLKNIMLANHVEKTNGKDMASHEKIDFIQNGRVSDNLMLGLTVDGEYAKSGNILKANTLQHLETEPLDVAVTKAREFNATRVSSPLAEMLEHTTQFITDQYQLFNEGKAGSLDEESNMNGANYLDASQDFADQLDGHINQVKRVSALVEAGVSVNPLINDFRINNPAGLTDEAKEEEIFVISGEDASYLQSELGIMLNKLVHLKEVNNYNKNNILAKLLRESGLDLASKYQTLKSIASVPAVMQLLPSLQQLFSLKNVEEYAEMYKTASVDLRNEALYEMAKFEDAVHDDFQLLNQEDKSKVVNATFKPIDTTNIKFYQSADGEKPYNEYAQTIYLAKTYGSSTMDFYKRFAGEFNSATQLFANLSALKHVPFSNQESAIRMNHLLANGDRTIADRLFNAFATEFAEDGVYNFDTFNIPTFKSISAQVLLGDPGTGKTTAGLLNSINILDKGQKDVLLLAPEQSQVTKLVSTLTDNGFEERIDADNSKIFREFMKSLSLRVRGTTKSFEFEENDKDLEFTAGSEMSQFKKRVTELFDTENSRGLGILKDGKLADSYTMADSIVNLLGRYKLIAVDEYTHINPLDLAVLHKLVDLYNGSSTVTKNPGKRITILDMGDTNQMGYLSEGGARRSFTDLTEAITSQPLTTSLRSGWDLVNNTLTDIRNRAIKYNHMPTLDLVKSETMQESIQAPIKANYTSNSEIGNVGIKVINKQDATTEGDLDFITSMKPRFTGGDLIYVVGAESQRSAAEAMLRSTLGENWNIFAKVATPKQVQGGEYKYAIIDAAPDILEGWPEGNAKYNIRRIHSFLNTMLSRATEATLYLKDSTVDPYVKFTSNPALKAIQQIKLDQKTKDEIKADKQALMGKILQDYTPKESVGPDIEESPEVKQTRAITVTKVDKISPLFAPATTEPKPFEGKSTDIISHNSYSTKKDFDTVFKLRFPEAMASDIDSAETQLALSRIINSYKYYLLHANRDGIGDRQIQLTSGFQSLFESNGYDWENPHFYVEAGRRGEDGASAGRSELTSDYGNDPKEIILNLKVRIPKLGTEPGDSGSLDLTMGFLSSISSLSTKMAKLPGNDARAEFFTGLKNWINGNKNPDGSDATPKKGLPIDNGSEDRRWQSGFFSKDEWDNTANVYGSRVIYDNTQRINYKDLKTHFFDFSITEPQVVVANLIDENNKSVLDPDNKNPNYADKGGVWDMLKGKAITFVSDVYELNTKSAKEMLDIYIKQLSYFNTPEFANLDDKGKQRYINELEDDIKTPANVTIRYRPGLVKLIKLDNPKSTFLDFRERFLTVIRQKTFRAKMTPDLLEQFNTSIYVKDRLVKSLLTLQKFLNSNNENRKWFTDNVISKWSEVAEANVNAMYRSVEQAFNNGEAYDRNSVRVDPLALEKSGLGNISMQQFREKLDDLLDPKAEGAIYRGKYATTNVTRQGEKEPNNVREYKGDLNPNITAADLDLHLTGNKMKDFAGSLIDIKMFSLFQKTKSANFAGVIDLSLRALAGFENNADFRKYDLSTIFRDGEIESVVIAQKRDPDVDATSNVLAEAISFGGDFSFNLGKLTHPFYAIDYDQFLAKLDGKEIGEPKPKQSEVAEEDSTPQEVPLVKPEPTKKGKVTLSDDLPIDSRYHNPDEEGTGTVKDAIVSVVEADFDHDSEIADLRIEPLKATAKKASYLVTTSNGSTYEMEYNMDTDNIGVKLVKPAPGTAKVDLQAIDKEEMAGYQKMVQGMFGSRDLGAAAPALDYFEQLFRHTMVTSNMTSGNVDFKLKDYDAKLASYNADAAYNEYDQMVADNFEAFRPINKELSNLRKYINDYKPTLC
jgi:hypothetical protein